MAKRLEDSLYRNARSFKEYKDHTTLRHRLQQLAARLGTNTQQNRAKVSQSESERLILGTYYGLVLLVLWILGLQVVDFLC